MRVSLSLISIYAFSLLGIASGLKKPAPASTEALLNIRGGAGPLDPMVVAKTGAALVGTQGLANVLCAEATLSSYGLTSASDDDIMIEEMIGFVQVSGAVTSALLLFYDMDVNSALAYGLVPLIISFAAGLINEVPKKFESSSSGYIFWMAADIALMYGLFTNKSWAIDAYKGVVILGAASYLYTRINPAKGSELYGRKKPLSPSTTAICKALSDNGLMVMIQSFALASGVDTLTTIGYAWAYSFVCLALSLFVEKDLDALKLDRNKMLVWLALAGVVTGTLLL